MLLLYFLAATGLCLVIDRGLVTPVGVYRLVWHPPLVRLVLFVWLFAGLVPIARP